MNRASSWRPPAVFLVFLVAPAAGAEASTLATSTAGMTIAVANCNDSGPGSLRNAVAGALSGDTVDMSGLACTAITLTSGAIVIPQQDLSFQGPGRDRLTIKGSGDRVFLHQGSGLLRLKKFSVARGVKPLGGCIYAQGRVELRGVHVHHCRAGGRASVAGGGIYAAGDVSLYDSAVDFNKAIAKDTPDDFLDESAYGGGIYSGGRLRIERSHICDNVAEASLSRYEPSNGGGAYAVAGLTVNRANIYDNTAEFGGGGLSASTDGNVLIINSTIARNISYQKAGGMEVRAGDGTVTIRNSTFSGNTGGEFYGLEGVYPSGSALDLPLLDVTIISNSTIAFNRNLSGSAYSCGGAVHGSDYADGGELRFQSTIVANNVCDDTYGGVEPLDIRAANIEGSHNLIQVATSAVPADTITTDPQLAPLAANGGPTKTHALPTISPAVDVGANPHGLQYDQRGPGYPRVKGARADIGAYER
jgi:hypothetical protein